MGRKLIPAIISAGTLSIVPFAVLPATAEIKEADFVALQATVTGLQKDLTAKKKQIEALEKRLTDSDVKIGSGASVAASNKTGAIAIGQGAKVKYSNGPSEAHGDIALG